MRWPFHRSESPPHEPDDTHDADAGDGTPSAGGAAEPEAPAGPAAFPAWASLPPLQRTIGDGPALTAPTADLVADVAERLSPTTSLEPLAHEVGPLAPRGTIGLTSAPIEASGPRPELVNRAAARPVTAQRAVAGTPPTPPASPDEPETPTVSNEPTPLPGVLPPPAGPRRLEAIEAAATPPDRSLVSAADPAGPPATASAATAETVLARSADHPASSEPSAFETQVRGSVNSSGIDAAETARPIRRPGLGAPLASGTGHGLQRSSDRAEPPHPSVAENAGPRVHVQRLVLGEGLVVRPARTPAVPVPGATGTETAPQTVVQRAPEPEAISSGDRTLPGSSGSVVTVGRIDVSRLAIGSRGRAALPSAPPTRPLVGRIEPSSVQRQAGDATVDAPTGSGQALLAAEGSALRLPGEPDSKDAVGPRRWEIAVARYAMPDAHSPAAPAPWVAVDRLPIEPGRPDDVGTGREAGSVFGTALIAARAVADDAPPIDLPHATPSPPSRLDAWPAVREVGVQRTHGGTAGPDRLPPLTLTRAASVPTATADVQRSTASAAGETPTATVARYAVNGPAPVPESGRGSPPTIDGEVFGDALVQRAAADDATEAAPSSAAAPGAGPAAVGGSEKDLDELARRLYDRFRLRLSRELLADRERAGALTDL